MASRSRKSRRGRTSPVPQRWPMAERILASSKMSFYTQGKVDSSPAICGDKVVVGSDDGRLYMISLETGKELWKYELGQPIGSSPAVAHGKVVIGSEDGNVYCFGGKGK